MQIIVHQCCSVDARPTWPLAADLEKLLQAFLKTSATAGRLYHEPSKQQHTATSPSIQPSGSVKDCIVRSCLPY